MQWLYIFFYLKSNCLLRRHTPKTGYGLHFKRTTVWQDVTGLLTHLNNRKHLFYAHNYTYVIIHLRNCLDFRCVVPIFVKSIEWCHFIGARTACTFDPLADCVETSYYKNCCPRINSHVTNAWFLYYTTKISIWGCFDTSIKLSLFFPSPAVDAFYQKSTTISKYTVLSVGSRREL